jgi:hypothetical protein
MKRAQLLAAAGVVAALLAPVAHATPVDVVKVINFSCPVCRASESLDNSIRDAVSATGGHFVPAPIPPDNSTGGARERVYYAARDMDPNHEPVIRASMFKGAQDMQMSLSDVPQTVAWLEDDIGTQVNLDGTQLQANAEGQAAQISLGKAARLVISSGAQALPTYIILKQGSIVGTLDVDSIQNKSLLNLRDAVVTAIGKASSAPN